jgi:hypothetical protein
LDFIVAESVPQQGIGAAINDRFMRAACRRGNHPNVVLADER